LLTRNPLYRQKQTLPYSERVPKKAEVAILTSDKVDFKLKLVRIDKKDHFILIKGATH
jgi:hypothetical protein